MPEHGFPSPIKTVQAPPPAAIDEPPAFFLFSFLFFFAFFPAHSGYRLKLPRPASRNGRASFFLAGNRAEAQLNAPATFCRGDGCRAFPKKKKF